MKTWLEQQIGEFYWQGWRHGFGHGVLLGLMIMSVVMAVVGCAGQQRLPIHTGSQVHARWCQAGPATVALGSHLTQLDTWAITAAEVAWDHADGRAMTVRDQSHEVSLPQVEVERVAGAVLHSSIEVDEAGCLHRCRITIGDAVIQPTVLRRALAHELGHCLGYTDDDVSGSIMHDGYTMPEVE